MHITFVKKRNPDGSSCAKCEEVERRLIRDGHLARIDEIAIADLADPDSAGMQLAREFNTEYAPFFIVRDGARLRQLGKNHARMGHFTRDRFVAEVETEPVVRRPADDPGEQRR